MPESKQELENISKLTDFDWSEYDKEGVYESSELKSVQFTINEDSYKMWQQWKERCKNILGYESENLCFEYAIIEALNIPEDTIRLKSKDEEK